MNAEEIIRFIHDAEKKTPVKVYIKTSAPVDFPGCKVFGTPDSVVFGEWSAIEPVLKANADKIPLTDDCSAAEHLGLNVFLTHGDEKNLKITTPMDLRIAKLLMEDDE